MNYLITGSRDWADEFNVTFFEIISEEDYQKYLIAKEIFVEFVDSYYFGINKGWDDFDYLSFEPIAISDSDLETLFISSLKEESVDVFFALSDEDAAEL